MLTIDGLAERVGGTLLDACRRAGAAVPALCHDPRTSAGGHCRSCMVEADGRVVAACTTLTRPGMTVVTRSPRLQAYRRDLGEMMLSEATPHGDAGRAVRDWGADGTRYPKTTWRGADLSHPLMDVDLDACILCRRCVRACEEIQGRFVWAVVERGGRAHLGWEGRTFRESPCVACGACAESCPSGAISPPAPRSPMTRTTCAYCGVGCQLDVHTLEGRIVGVTGGDGPANRGHLCVKGRYAWGWQASDERLRTPLVRRGGALEPATWEEAIAIVAREMSKGEAAGLSSARCTNEENYLFQRWMRAGLGTNDVDCCARVCHAPSAAGMRRALGTGAATNSLDDIERADLLMVVGANPTESHPVTGARIRQAVLRGAKLVVIDPRRTELAAMADVHLAVRPGANVPLFNALAAVLVAEDLVDSGFIAAHVTGWEEYREWILARPPESVALSCGVPAASIRAAARLYGRASRPMMVHGLGVTEHLQGSESVTLLCNLALLAGALGRPGVGVNPLRGQNNVQGAADMGCQPDLLPGYAALSDTGRFAAAWGRPVPATPGRTLPEMLQDARSGRLKRLFVLGEDLLQTDPDAGHVRAALENLEFLAVQELFLSETARLADVVLPAAGPFEKDGTFTNGERRIQRVRTIVDPPGEARPDWRILCALSEACGLPSAFASPAAVMDEIASVVPSFAGVRYDRLDGHGLQWPVPSLSHPGTPILHTGDFRGRLHRVEWLPSPSLGGLSLVTGRRLEHYNCGTMTRRSDTVRLATHDTLDIHPADAAVRGIGEGDRVRVVSASGDAVAAAHLSETLRQGMVFMTFHFPETGTNRVTGDVRDRWTGCPEYKLTRVEVAPVPKGPRPCAD